MEARDLQRTVRAQRQADAAAVDRAEFQRVLAEARRQDTETRRLVRCRVSAGWRRAVTTYNACAVVL